MDASQDCNYYRYVQSGASGCEKGLVECFINVPLAVGPILQLPFSPSKEGQLIRKHVTKPFSQPDAPDCGANLGPGGLFARDIVKSQIFVRI